MMVYDGCNENIIVRIGSEKQGASSVENHGRLQNLAGHMMIMTFGRNSKILP